MIPNGSIAVSSRRVLVIENSAEDRQLLRNLLNAEKIEMYEAQDIMTGLSACQMFQPSLILLQLRLNTWDGFEVIRRLKDDPRTRSIPVIFISSSAVTAEKAKGMDMGAVDFVSKPYDPVELLARVNSALRTKTLLDLLEQRAHLDGLTELGNRFALNDALPSEMAACREANRPLSLVMADIDHFKKVNDRYGHAAGDEVLRRVAMLLRSSVHQSDFLGRYGGEEFVVLCPGRPLDDVLKTAAEIRHRVAETTISFRSSVIPVTLSLGVTSIEPGCDDVKPAELLEQADLALYRSKSGGRNAVSYWDAQCKSAIPAPVRLAASAAT